MNSVLVRVGFKCAAQILFFVLCFALVVISLLTIYHNINTVAGLTTLGLGWWGSVVCVFIACFVSVWALLMRISIPDHFSSTRLIILTALAVILSFFSLYELYGLLVQENGYLEVEVFVPLCIIIALVLCLVLFKSGGLEYVRFD